MTEKSTVHLGVSKMIGEFDKNKEKRAIKRENLLISYVMKSVEREQGKNILISKLRTELHAKEEIIIMLQIENEVKEKLIHMKDEELQSLKNENTKLMSVIRQPARNPKTKSPIKKKMPMIRTINNNKIVKMSNNDSITPITDPTAESTRSSMSTTLIPTHEKIQTKLEKVTDELKESEIDQKIVPSVKEAISIFNGNITGSAEPMIGDELPIVARKKITKTASQAEIDRPKSKRARKSVSKIESRGTSVTTSTANTMAETSETPIAELTKSTAIKKKPSKKDKTVAAPPMMTSFIYNLRKRTTKTG